MQHASPRKDAWRQENIDLATFWEEALRRDLGMVFVPVLSSRTPPYLEHVEQGSLADAAGLNADDLVIAVDGVQVIDAREAAISMLSAQREGTACQVTVLRDEAIETYELRSSTSKINSAP